jgi:hypothetical protein
MQDLTRALTSIESFKALKLLSNFNSYLQILYSCCSITQLIQVLCRDSSDIEIFLIGTAALANITFIDNIACEFLNQFSTAQVLIENCYLKNFDSIFVKDQVRETKSFFTITATILVFIIILN